MYRHDFLGWEVSIEVLDTHYVLVLIITLNSDFFFPFTLLPFSYHCSLFKKKKSFGFSVF